MPSDRCKLLELTSARMRRRIRSWSLAAVIGLGALSACGTHPRGRAISVCSLETASTSPPIATQRTLVSDTADLEHLYYPLGRRLGLFQIKTTDEWEALCRHAPELGPSPDFSRGIVVGMASRVGMPLDGTWPIHLQSMRIHEHAGFAIARFEGGSFLPDGTTYLETAQFDGLAVVLMVEVNGLRFYPE